MTADTPPSTAPGATPTTVYERPTRPPGWVTDFGRSRWHQCWAICRGAASRCAR